MFNNQNYSKVLNVPGGAGGETNGLYAAMTETEYFPPDNAYLSDNTPSVFDVASNVISGVTQLQQQVAVARANANVKPAPTVQAEWNGLTVFEKAAFVLVVFGAVYLIVKA